LLLLVTSTVKWVNIVKWVKWAKWVKHEISEFGEIKVNMVALVNIEWRCYETEICTVSIGDGGDRIVTSPLDVSSVSVTLDLITSSSRASNNVVLPRLR